MIMVLLQHLIKAEVVVPSVDNYYEEIIKYPNIVRVVALSGGYSRKVSIESSDRVRKTMFIRIRLKDNGG